MVQGTLDLSSQTVCKIKAQDLVPLDILFEQWPSLKNVSLTLPTALDTTLLDSVTSAFDDGSTPLHLEFSENGEQLVARPRRRVQSSLEKLQKLEDEGIGIRLIL